MHSVNCRGTNENSEDPKVLSFKKLTVDHVFSTKKSKIEFMVYPSNNDED
jgi:hypothetical protein